MSPKDVGRNRSVHEKEGSPELLELPEPDAESLALAQRIRAEREYLKLNQAQVADVLGIPRAAVSALETGRRRVSGLELKKLASLFGTSGDRLLGNEMDDDPTALALFRTANALTDDDRQQVLRFAEFLREAGPAPTIDFDAEP
jgi:transcriptional regulator with XRE-family HTH domain